MYERYISQLAHVKITSPKIEASLAFYKDVLGLEESGRDGGSVFLRGWGEHFYHSLEIVEGKEPSPKRLAAIISQAKAKGYKVVFVQPQMSRRTAETIAQAIGAKIVVADPLAEDWAGNLKAVAEGFRSALK